MISLARPRHGFISSGDATTILTPGGQEILASNIANADTPNYKAVDIDIKQALKSNTPLSQVPVQFSVTSNAGVDGNTVDMDMERVKFAENSLMYEFAVDKVKEKYKSMIDLLQNLPY